MSAEEIADLRDAIEMAQSWLLDALVDNCPGTHEPIQHRDRMPPWCRSCGYSNDGVRRKDVSA